jgi:hypothetical protein
VGGIVGGGEPRACGGGFGAAAASPAGPLTPSAAQQTCVTPGCECKAVRLFFALCWWYYFDYDFAPATRPRVSVPAATVCMIMSPWPSKRRYLADMSVPVNDCSIPYINYYGNDLAGGSFVGDATSCQTLCTAQAACSAWTVMNGAHCYLKSSNLGMKADDNAVSGPHVCESRRASGYEVLVTDTGSASVHFAVSPCEFPIANQTACARCGNRWKTTGCEWWDCTCLGSCSLVPYCSSPEMQTLPADWINRKAALSHYGNPTSGCLADEATTTITNVAGSFCAPKCQIDGTCSADVPPGATATPVCGLAYANGTKVCALQCASAADCGASGKCMTVSSYKFCLY